MKIEQIEEYETGSHCFGKVLSVNDTNYEDLDVEDAIELINDVMRRGYNKDIFIKETFEAALSYLEFDCVESDSSSCDQCGDWNFYEKWVKDVEDSVCNCTDHLTVTFTTNGDYCGNCGKLIKKV